MSEARAFSSKAGGRAGGATPRGGRRQRSATGPSAVAVARQAVAGPRRGGDNDLSTIELDATDERAIDRALASVREGRGVSLRTFRTILRRL